MPLKDFNPKQIVRNWKIVRSNPYSSLKFQYIAARALIIVLCLFIIYQITMMVIRYDSGSNLTTLITKIVLVIVGVVVVIKFYGTLDPLKKSLQHYENLPPSQNQTFQNIDVDKEVNEILANIERNKQNQQNQTFNNFQESTG